MLSPVQLDLQTTVDGTKLPYGSSAADQDLQQRHLHQGCYQEQKHSMVGVSHGRVNDPTQHSCATDLDMGAECKGGLVGSSIRCGIISTGNLHCHVRLRRHKASNVPQTPLRVQHPLNMVISDILRHCVVILLQ